MRSIGAQTVRHLVQCLAVLVFSGAQPVGASPPTLPPILPTASSEHHPGKVIWAELVTPDVGAAEKFYAGLFHWSFRDVPSLRGTYTIAYAGDRPVGSILYRALPASGNRQPHWLTFIATADVDATLNSAIAHGGKAVAEPATYPERGRQAVMTDPQGATFAILSSSSGDPPDVLAEPGEWIWSSLHTSDAAAGATFYQTVFGYDLFDTPAPDGRAHSILSSDEYARASVNGFPESPTPRHAHWLNYIRVTDADATAALAITLGGHVIVEPHADRHGGKIAVVSDPSGAPIGIMEWSATDTKQEPK
jgi:predicted enzyme related to lactoylglutathione lyase